MVHGQKLLLRYMQRHSAKSAPLKYTRRVYTHAEEIGAGVPFGGGEISSGAREELCGERQGIPANQTEAVHRAQ